MVLGVLVLATGGALTAGAVLRWKTSTKPWLEQKLCGIVKSQATQALAGSTCDLEKIEVTLGSQASVVLHGFVVHNLEPYKSKSLLNLEKVAVSIDLKGAITSSGKKINIIALEVGNCRLTYEKGFDITTSNIKDLMNKMKENKTPKPEAPKPDEKSTSSILVGKVDISGVSVENTTTLFVQAGTPGAVVPLPPLRFENFSEKHGELGLSAFIHALLTELFGLVLHTLMHAPDTLLHTAEEGAGWIASIGASIFGR